MSAEVRGIRNSALSLPNAEQRLGHFYLHRVDGTTAPILLYNPITGITYTSGDISSGSNACTSDTQNQARCFRQTQQNYVSGLTSPANFNPRLVTTRYIPLDFTTGYMQSYFLDVQRTLPGVLLDLAYVGNGGRHIQVLADYNQATPCLAPSLSGCASYQLRRPVPTFGDIEISLPIGISS